MENETDRRRRTIEEGRTDTERWGNPAQLEAAWAPRGVAAARLIPAGARVLDIGCGAMALERALPFGCVYRPADVVARDDRTLVFDLNTAPLPAAAAADIDIVALLGVWEYLYDPGALFAALAAARLPIVCSYCVNERTPDVARRRSLGWVNDFTTEQFIALAQQHGYHPRIGFAFDDLQLIFKLELGPEPTPPARKRVHVLSSNEVGNFGDRLGYHVLNEMLPAHADVTWGKLRPIEPPTDKVDLLVVGIGNSLFGQYYNSALNAAVDNARASIGIFGTQYRTLWPKRDAVALIDRLTTWWARYEEDMAIYGRGKSNVRHLGDWLINAFPMARWTDESQVRLGAKQMWGQNLPLDRVIQSIQRHRSAFSERLHPLLCAMTSAETVGYREQREEGGPAESGKFRSMLMDVLGYAPGENTQWEVDREAVALYKARVRTNSDALAAQIRELLS